MIAIDGAVGVSSSDLAVSWSNDEEASALGPVSREPANGEQFLPGVVEVLVIPLAVNIASTALYNLVRRLVRRCRRPSETSELELSEMITGDGDRLLVVRARQVRL
jgi:hypothetical protein